ncbi:hypothetical protein MRX96_005871 [Rhipicephalus microplus]
MFSRTVARSHGAMRFQMPGRAFTAAVAAVPVPRILVLSRSAAAGASHARRDGRASIASSCMNFMKFPQMQAAARRAADAAARSDNTGSALEPPAVPGPGPENQERNGAEVELRRGNWYLNEKWQTIFSATTVAL